MGRIRNTIDLAKASWSVLKQDKELLALPVISAVASLVVAATFLIPLFASSGFDPVSGQESISSEPLTWILLALLYFSMAFITIFFNAALVHAANERMDGGDPTIASAISGARRRLHRILPWALVSATVSAILRAIEERAGAIGKFVSAIAGLAWSLVTFLVLPILMIEDVGVRDALKGSANLFKRTWGENVAAQIGFGLLGFVAILPALLVGGLGIAAGGALAVVGISVAVAWVLLVVVVIAALSVIFQTALYRYARDGQADSHFGEGTLRGSFAHR